MNFIDIRERLLEKPIEQIVNIRGLKRTKVIGIKTIM